MSALGKYHIIEADTLDAIKCYRAHIEQTLKIADLTSEDRAELEWALRRAWDKQNAAQKAEDECEEEKERKRKEGEGDAGGEQQSGSSSGGSSGDGGPMHGNEEGSNDDLSDFELFALLLFMAEQDINQPRTSSVDAQPSAAATLLFNKDNGIAQINESYTLTREGHAQAPSDFVPALENHAAAIGAQILQLKVHPDAVPLFQKKLGYKPYGKLFKRNGTPVQRMRKTLTGQKLLMKNNTVN